MPRKRFYSYRPNDIIKNMMGLSISQISHLRNISDSMKIKL